MKRIIFVLLLAVFPLACHDNTVAPVVAETFPPSRIWWNDDVFYEIFVRSFYDTNGDGMGDFQGIIAKLDYLNDGDPNTNTDLGVTAIWLMPVYPSPSYHGYDVTDFRNVNPQYGTMDDFEELVSEAHKRGIKVILDFEVTATSDKHPWFVNSASSPIAGKRDWYIWSNTNPGYQGSWGQTVWHGSGGAYYYGTFSSAMPHLNYKNGDVTAEIKDITRFWYQDMKVDGFRMDAASLMIEEGARQVHTESTLAWWRSYYLFQKGIDSAFMTVGEVWDPTSLVSPYADHRLDYCFEFDLATAIIAAVQNGNVSALTDKINEVINTYPELQYGTFLTNHDQNRVIENLSFDYAKAKVAAGILLTLPGIPYLYYGEEVGMRGQKPDEDIRRPMQWNNGASAGFTTSTPWRGVNPDYAISNVSTMKGDSSSLWNHYRRLIHARTASKALKRGNYEPVTAGASQLFSFLRIKDGAAVMAIHNLSGVARQSVRFSASASSLSPGNFVVTDLLTGDDLGTLTVGSKGSFDFSPVPEITGYSTTLLRLVRP